MNKEELLNLSKEYSDYLQSLNSFTQSVTEFERAVFKFYNSQTAKQSFRGVPFVFWKEILQKYDEKKLLNADGEIFFIDQPYYYDNDTGECKIGRRVRWDLTLSKESYQIYEDIDYDLDGEFNFKTYEYHEIKVK